MCPDINGKTALVTGGSQRIGRAITLALAKAGAHVVIHYNRSEKQADETVTEVVRSGVKAWKIQAELSAPDEVEQLISKVHNQYGRIDYLINNASVFPESSLVTLSMEEMNHTININAAAPLILSRNFVRQTKNGVIINLLDNRIKRFDLNHVSYQLSKSMLCTLTKMMAIEYAPHVRVNGIAPGIILPPVGKKEIFQGKQQSKTLLRPHGDLEDITDAVLFLLSHKFMTGEILYIEGGQNLKDLKLESVVE
ncbi:MAG: SDR family oxidoreductase [Candidatus Latescibacteria bacterium]|nr:SDR family oxidoreductase [Candidatus Latescibacterota bacterium]